MIPLTSAYKYIASILIIYSKSESVHELIHTPCHDDVRVKFQAFLLLALGGVE
jgi:hypothetical protein